MNSKQTWDRILNIIWWLWFEPRRSPVINPVIVDTGRVTQGRVGELASGHNTSPHGQSPVSVPLSLAILPVIDLFVHWPPTGGILFVCRSRSRGAWPVSNIEQESVGARVLLPGHRDIIIYNGPWIVSVLSISCLVLFSFWVLSGLWRLAAESSVEWWRKVCRLSKQLLELINYEHKLVGAKIITTGCGVGKKKKKEGKYLMT